MPTLVSYEIVVALAAIFMIISFKSREIAYPALAVVFWFAAAFSAVAYYDVPLLNSTIANYTSGVTTYQYVDHLQVNDYHFMYLFFGLGFISIAILVGRVLQMFKEAVT